MYWLVPSAGRRDSRRRRSRWWDAATADLAATFADSARARGGRLGSRCIFFCWGTCFFFVNTKNLVSLLAQARHLLPPSLCADRRRRFFFASGADSRHAAASGSVLFG